MKYLLDTNICILLLDGRNFALNARASECVEGELAFSAIAFAELAKGSAAGKPPPMGVLDLFLSDVALLPFDEAAARTYASLPFRRGSFDRLIAAHALSLGLTLVTNNESDFTDVAGLMIENWTQ